MPDPKEKGEQGESAGELGKSLEFLMLKVAQLETLAELQQTELGMHRALIEKLLKKVDPDEAEIALVQKQKSSEQSVQEAHDVLKRVVQKHAHQRKHREYHPEAHKQKPGPSADEEEELEEVEQAVSDGHAESPGPGQQRGLAPKARELDSLRSNTRPKAPNRAQNRERSQVRPPGRRACRQNVGQLKRRFPVALLTLLEG